MALGIDLRLLFAFASECHYQIDGHLRKLLEVVFAALARVSQAVPG